MTDKKLKAYKWDDEYEGTTAIVYAESAGKAKAEIANDNDIAFTEVKVYRLPWADEYGDQENIPPEVYFEHGWSLWCHRCGNEVCEDEAVIDGEAVYCSLGRIPPLLIEVKVGDECRLFFY